MRRHGSVLNDCLGSRAGDCVCIAFSIGVWNQSHWFSVVVEPCFVLALEVCKRHCGGMYTQKGPSADKLTDRKRPLKAPSQYGRHVTGRPDASLCGVGTLPRGSAPIGLRPFGQGNRHPSATFSRTVPSVRTKSGERLSPSSSAPYFARSRQHVAVTAFPAEPITNASTQTLNNTIHVSVKRVKTNWPNAI